MYLANKKKKFFAHLFSRLRYRFLEHVRTSRFPSEILSDVRTYVAPVMMHSGI